MEGREAAKEEANAVAEETARSPEKSNDGSRGGRSFDCTFCKRGFSNAQALGGHMNIHRKERARMQPADSLTAACPETSSWYYATNAGGHYLDSLKNFTAYFSESTHVCRTEVRSSGGDDDMHPLRPLELSLFGEEATVAGSSSCPVDPEGKKNKEEEEGEVDLELRLGFER